jgi:peptidoglycan/LPS O-acetylase OafA/YrhL
MGRQKINELDFIRTIAFLAVVMQHVLGVYLGRDVLGWESAGISVLFFLSKFAVPAFVFVSGLVLFYNYYENLKYGSFILKRIREILVPYMIWTAFYFFYNNPLGVRSLGGLLNVTLLGKGAYHLWYVVMIFQFYLFLPVYIALFKGIQKLVSKTSGRIIVFTVFTLAYVIYILIPSYLTPMGVFKPQNPVVKFLFLDYITRNSISYIFYFVMGALIGLNLDKFRAFIKRYTAAISTAFITGFLILEWFYFKNGFVNGKISVNYPSFFKPHYFLFIVLTLLFLYRLAISKKLNASWLSKAFSFIGSYSYQAYLAHAFTLNTAAFILYKTNITFRPLIYGLVFLGCIASSLCIAFMFRFVWTHTKTLYSRLKLRLRGRIKIDDEISA